MVKVDRKKLIEALEIIRPVMGSDDQKVFAFDNARIHCYNQDSNIWVPFETGLAGCVMEPDAFCACLENMRADKIELAIKVTKPKTDVVEAGTNFKHLIVKSDTKDMVQRGKFPLLPNEDFSPQIRKLRKGKTAEVSKDFVRGLGLCLKTLGNPDLTDPALFGLRVQGKDMFSSDNYRISWYTLDTSMTNMLLPEEAARMLVSLKPTSYLIRENEAFFAIPFGSGGLYATALLNYKYPESKEFFKGFEAKGYRLPKISIQDTVNLVQGHFDSEDPLSDGMVVSIKGDVLSTSTYNPLTDLKYETATRLKGKKGISLKLSARYLRDAFTLAEGEEGEITYQKSKDGKSICLTTDSYRQAILLPVKEASE